jgi:hypothetical protein
MQEGARSKQGNCLNYRKRNPLLCLPSMIRAGPLISMEISSRRRG